MFNTGNCPSVPIVANLDGYIKELGGDITQLIGDMTAEERNLMRTKLSTLVSKL